MHMSHTTGSPLPKAHPRISKSDFRKSVGWASGRRSLTRGCGVSRTPDSFQIGRYTLERSAAAFEQAGGRARGEVVTVAVEVRLAQPEAGALAGAARKRQARAATKEDVEMVVVNLRVVAHRRRAKERAGFGAGLRANPGFGRVIQRRKDYALLMQGYNSRRSVELPAVWPNARFVGKGLRNRRRALARGQAPPLRLEAEVFLRDSRGSRSSLRDAGPARIAPLEFAKYRLDPGWAPG